MTTAATIPPTMTTASTPTSTQTHMGMEPLSPSESCVLPADALEAFPLTSWGSMLSKVTLLPLTSPPSASVTLPGKVTDWESFT